MQHKLLTFRNCVPVCVHACMRACVRVCVCGGGREHATGQYNPEHDLTAMIIDLMIHAGMKILLSKGQC